MSSFVLPAAMDSRSAHWPTTLMLASLLWFGDSPTIVSQEPTSATSTDNGAASQLWAGLDAAKRGQTREAYERLAAALQLNPELVDAYRVRAQLSFQQRDYPAAIADLTEALRRRPNNQRLYYLRGRAYLRVQQYAEALQDFDDLILLGTGDAFRPQLYRGVALAKLGRTADAVAELEQVVNDSPDVLPALGELYLQENCYAQSATCFTLAIDGRLAEIAERQKFVATPPSKYYDAQSPHYRVPLGAERWLNFTRSSFEEKVLKQLDKFTTTSYRDRQLAALYIGRGTCLLSAYELSHAAADFQDAIKFTTRNDPERKQAVAQLLQTSDESGVIPLADECVEATIAAMSRAIGADSANVALYKVRGDAHWAQGDLTEALSDYNQAIALEPENAMLYLARGQLFVDHDELAAAIADFTQVLKLDPRYHLSAYQNRGDSHRRQGELKRAAADYFEVIRLKSNDFETCLDNDLARRRAVERVANLTKRLNADTDNAELYLDRGSCYFLLGDYEKAIADFQRLRRLDPRSTGPLMHLGEVYLKSGDRERAIGAFREAVLESSDDPLAIAGLANAYYATSRYGEAQALCTRCVEREHDRAPANVYAVLARIYLECPDETLRDAENGFQAAKRASGDFPGLMASAFAAAGDYRAAVTWGTAAVPKATKAEAPEIARRLAEYMARMPDPRAQSPKARDGSAEDVGHMFAAPNSRDEPTNSIDEYDLEDE